jgi:hypothetical protein
LRSQARRRFAFAFQKAAAKESPRYGRAGIHPRRKDRPPSGVLTPEVTPILGDSILRSQARRRFAFDFQEAGALAPAQALFFE